MVPRTSRSSPAEEITLQGAASALPCAAKFSLRRKIQGLQPPWRVSSDASTHRDEQLDLL